MDYSIGSLSDLITGSVTPNKKKVIKKEIKLEDNGEEESLFVSLDVKEAKSPAKSPVKKKKNKLIKNGNEVISPATQSPAKSPNKKMKNKPIQNGNETLSPETETTPKKVAKKRKLENGENVPAKKKSKNANNAEKRIKKKKKPENPDEDPERLARTVFVGNLPITLTPHKFKRLFSKFGQVDAVRIRGAPVADPKTPKKVAVIKKEFHPDRKSFYGFVRYMEVDDAKKAEEADGIVFLDHHLRVHLCGNKEKRDENKAIFVGNLSFQAEEDELWKTFESCGPVSSVRIVRDARTGMGKGFGYVNFQNSDAVTLALEMENVKLKDRELRISACNLNAAKKNSKKNKMKKITKAGKAKRNRMVKGSPEGGEDTEKSEVVKKENNKQSFQGTQFMQKKKKKLDKGLLQKKKKIKQIAPQ